MNDRMRILSTGELHTGDLRLQFVPLDSFELTEGYSDFEAALAEAFGLAATHGAVMFEFDYADPYTERPQEDWKTRILLCVDSACLRLRTPTLDRLLVAQRWQGDEQASSSFFVALIPTAELDSAEEAGILLTYIRALPAYRDGRPPVWQLGDEATLQALRPPAAQRDWDWAWRGATWGPVYLWIVVDRTADELAAWLDSVVPYGYQPIRPKEPFLFEYQIDPALEDFEGRLSFIDGLITFLRSYRSPGDLVQAIDAVLLASIAVGELGEVSWDLFDGEYFHYLATGEGLDSLREYLDPSNDEAQLCSRWRSLLAQQTVDASTAESWQQVAELVLLHFHADAIPLDPCEGLELWLRTAPITALPRQMHIVVSQEVFDTYETDPFPTRMIEANRRVVCSIGTG